jgi:hypothetical protein
MATQWRIRDGDQQHGRSQIPHREGAAAAYAGESFRRWGSHNGVAPLPREHSRFAALISVSRAEHLGEAED